MVIILFYVLFKNVAVGSCVSCVMLVSRQMTKQMDQTSEHSDHHKWVITADLKELETLPAGIQPSASHTIYRLEERERRRKRHHWIIYL